MGQQIEAAQTDSDTQTEISMVDEDASQTLQGERTKRLSDSNLTRWRKEKIQWRERPSRDVNWLQWTWIRVSDSWKLAAQHSASDRLPMYQHQWVPQSLSW